MDLQLQLGIKEECIGLCATAPLVVRHFLVDDQIA